METQRTLFARVLLRVFASVFIRGAGLSLPLFDLSVSAFDVRELLAA